MPRPVTADPGLTVSHAQRSRRVQALLALIGLPLWFAGWAIAASRFGLDVVFTARAAWLSAVPLLIAIIFVPLCLAGPRETRWQTFVVQWFLFSSLWIIAWEAPPVLYSSAFEDVAYTLDNLPRYIWWWGYFSFYLDYGERTPFFRLAELSWWVIVVPVVAGLIQLRRGRVPQALLLLGLCGALQFYNVCYYMAYGGIVENFDNVASDSILAPLLYWILNALWGVAGGIASALAFRLLFRRYVLRAGSGSDGTT